MKRVKKFTEKTGNYLHLLSNPKLDLHILQPLHSVTVRKENLGNSMIAKGWAIRLEQSHQRIYINKTRLEAVE